MFRNFLCVRNPPIALKLGGKYLAIIKFEVDLVKPRIVSRVTEIQIIEFSVCKTWVKVMYSKWSHGEWYSVNDLKILAELENKGD